MNSSSLISLFKDNTLSRSNSLSQNTLIRHPILNKSQSQSKLLNKSSTSQQTHKYAPLCRALFLLEKKVAKLNYFFFCRLQRVNKDKPIKMINDFQQKIESIAGSMNKDKKPNEECSKNVIRLIECIEILHAKYNFSYKLQIGFTIITKVAKKNKSLQIFNKFKTKYQNNLQKDFFVNFMSFSCMSLKFDCFSFGIINLYKNHNKRRAFQILKDHMTKEENKIITLLTSTHEESLSYSEDSTIRQTTKQDFENHYNFNNIKKKKTYISNNKPRIEITMSKRTNIQQNSIKEDNVEIKTRIQQPRKLPIISKAVVKMPKIQNDIISSDLWAHPASQQKINLIHKIHPEIKTNQIPDINDNKVFGNNRPSFLDRMTEQINIGFQSQKFKTPRQTDNFATNRSFYKKLVSQQRSENPSLMEWSSKISSKLKQSGFSQATIKCHPSQNFLIDQTWKNKSRFSKVSGTIEQIDRTQQKSMLMSMYQTSNVIDRNKLVVHLNRKPKSSFSSSPSSFSKSMKNFSMIVKQKRTGTNNNNSIDNKQNIKQKTHRYSKQKKVKQFILPSKLFKKKQKDSFDQYFKENTRQSCQYYTKQTEVSPQKVIYKVAEI